MAKTVFQTIVLFVVLTLLQVVCNKIILFNVATPIIFIYVLFRIPINLAKVWIFIIAFLMGLTVDIFGNTPGMNAITCTLVSALRLPVFNLYVSREDEMSSPLPSIDSLGIGNYFKYMSTLVILYCFFLFLIQAFTLKDVLLTVERMGFSSMLSIILILGIDSLVSTRREKRL